MIVIAICASCMSTKHSCIIVFNFHMTPLREMIALPFSWLETDTEPCNLDLTGGLLVNGFLNKKPWLVAFADFLDVHALTVMDFSYKSVVTGLCRDVHSQLLHACSSQFQPCSGSYTKADVSIVFPSLPAPSLLFSPPFFLPAHPRRSLNRISCIKLSSASCPPCSLFYWKFLGDMELSSTVNFHDPYCLKLTYV